MRYRYFVNEKNKTVACKFDKVGKYSEDTNVSNFHNAIKELVLSKTDNKWDREIMGAFLESRPVIKALTCNDVPVGVAKCLPEDTFDINFGKQLAKRKLDRKAKLTVVRLMGIWADTMDDVSDKIGREVVFD